MYSVGSIAGICIRAHMHAQAYRVDACQHLLQVLWVLLHHLPHLRRRSLCAPIHVGVELREPSRVRREDRLGIGVFVGVRLCVYVCEADNCGRWGGERDCKKQFGA